MSAASTPPHQERYVDFDEYVEFQLDKTRKSIKSNDLLTATAVAAVVALAFLLTFVVLDHWVVAEGFSVAARWCWFVSIIAATCCWLAWKVVYPSLRRVNRLFAARELEQASPALRSNLLNWVDLRDAGRTVHPGVMQTIEKQAATQLSKMDVGQAVDHRALLQASYALLAVVMLFCGYALFSPKKISTALWRIFPFSAAGAVTRTEIREVTPGDATLLLRGRLEVGVVLGGDIPGEVQMLYTTVDGRVQDESVLLRPESTGSTRFRGVFAGENGAGVLQDFSYVIVAGDAKSTRFRVTVHQPPSATVQQVDLHFPEYMKLEDAASPGGNIDGWEGAEATISATADKPARSAVLQFLDDLQSPPTGEEVPVTVTDGTQLRAVWKLEFRTDGTFPKHYRIQCRNEAGEVDPSPAVYNVVIRPDRPPEVALLHPERDLEAPANAVIPLLVQASDPDFELGYVTLQAEKGGQFLHRDQLSEGRQPRITVKHDFELSSLNLKPGDEIEFWVEAYDNKQPRRNRKNTPRLKIKIQDPVSKQQAEQQLAAEEEQRDQRLKESQQEQQRQDDAQANAGDRDEDAAEKEREPTERDERARSENADQPNEPGNPPQKNGDSPRENRRDKPQGDRQQAQQKANGSGDSTDPANESAKEKAGEPPLSPDGDDDEEALRRLNEVLNKNREQGSEKTESEKQEPDRQPPQTKTNGDNAEEEQSPSDGAGKQKSPTKKDKPGAAPNNDPPQPMPNEDADPSENPDPGGKSDKQSQPKNSGGKKEGGDAAKTNPAGQPQPGDASDDAEKPDPTGKGKAKNSTQKDGQGRSNPAQPEKKPGAAGDADTQQNPDAEQNPQENTKSDSEPDQKQTGGKKQQKENQSKSPTGKSDANNDPAGNEADSSNTGDNNSSDNAQESPGKTGKNNSSKSSPGGKNSQPKPSAEKSDAGNDSSENSDSNSSEPDDKGGNEANGDKPNGDRTDKQPSPGKDGKQPSEKSKTNSKDKNSGEPGEKNQDAGGQDPAGPKTERQSDDSENRRPGAGSEAEGESEPKKPKSPSPQKNPGAKKTNLENDKDAERSEKPQPSAKQKIEGETEAADEELKGPGRKDGQRSEQPDGGEGGGSKQDKEGNPGSKTKGPGEKSTTPGKESVADEKTGQSDPQERQGEGSKTKPGTKEGKSEGKKAGEQSDKPGADKPGGKSGEPTGDESGSEAGDGDQPGAGDEGKAGEGKEGKPSGKGTGKKPSGKPGSGSPEAGSQAGTKGPRGPGNPQGGDGTGEGGAGEGGNADDVVANPDEANLEFNRQAAELVLQRVRDDLNNNHVDPKLLEELGWTPEQLKRFTERLAKQLEKPAGELTPQEEARRLQFEETLKNLDLKTSGAKRAGGNSPNREVDQSGTRRAPVHPDYKASWEALTRNLSKQGRPVKKESDASSKRR